MIILSKKARITLRVTRFLFLCAPRKKAFSFPLKTKSHPPAGEWAFLLSRDAGI